MKLVTTIKYIPLYTTLFLFLFSCTQSIEDDLFDAKISIIENDPYSYLSRIDTTGATRIRNGKEATDFLLSALTLNNIRNDYYPSKEQLQKSIWIFNTEKLVQQQLEALYLLAKVYRKENNLTNEVHTIVDTN